MIGIILLTYVLFYHAIFQRCKTIGIIEIEGALHLVGKVLSES